MKVTIVAGTRPNFVKASAILREAQRRISIGENWFKIRFVHTGQHYDPVLSELFFKELHVPDPDINLMAGSGTHAEQTAEIMVKFEKELVENKPDLVMVLGDVNSTMACAITAKKLNIKVAHVESGLRSGDMSMPEEINRILTDSITDYHFTTTESASANLMREGNLPASICFAGNTMVDTLLANLEKISTTTHPDIVQEPFILLTLHRPSNVNNSANLYSLITNIANAARPFKVVFPIHPRLTEYIRQTHPLPENLLILPAQSYFNFLSLMLNSQGVITDSGGISEETTVLNIPCISLRTSTERPETLEKGTNVLCDGSESSLSALIEQMKSSKWKQSEIPDRWDGMASRRIWEFLQQVSQGLLNPCSYY